MTALMDQLEAIKAFVESGGEVLVLIAILTFVMWTLIFERLWYFKGTLKRDVQGALDTWEARPERQSWNAHQIRYALISRVSEKVRSNMSMIETLVSLAPLFGLLGTVWGMIEVFNVLAITGGGDAKSMASGVSKATIPTMAGMVAALSGVFGNTLVTRIAERENQLLADHLTMDH
ncbi:MotA/TolQ/ExbB proton channel family protein [Pseudoteredinibacter isoporae]|uniref:Biopolymer transport protein ExbB n=1 Tax=Pseudoteredinibacter isoporae TaxID=570281 RepID=A0A7X0JRJ1_9GAMM|nr:MotA/TolQ/ExbB proton channel family protein [Pseudoteredinibacter isoporae]MBB6520454.1 biopolymer transport protein ExbB [Pseudoteredinibacter isoporae]NHO86021.1 MotA/TolQ/ExbB proton channel family protein [Pseudoteredinibacter isoporae]NIB25528.1 MotA/TolQ/ExbB proton channel family protein [Pseudoteredinibacter isoporae]